jgi:hypothetical protein
MRMSPFCKSIECLIGRQRNGHFLNGLDTHAPLLLTHRSHGVVKTPHLDRLAMSNDYIRRIKLPLMFF